MSLNVRVALLTLVVALLLVNVSIYHKQQLLANGQVVYVELGPVDPRSLMQGDYMALRFQLGQAVHNALPRAEPDQS
ncbi:MAG: GDYXXLXY domain-containing protein, partial [Gammaproteobacteria bacterium]